MKEKDPNLPEGGEDAAMEHAVALSEMYENWFLDYASYVILDRAVPYLIDGMKPVQRRILHAMNEMDDGRFNKVANIIGQTMQYHPHGDASIGEALVKLGQKDLLVDTQGNWGNIHTGDGAAAPRYIEARLSKFALETVFNPDITDWQVSYDGRKREPVNLPVKFPLVLAQGVEGIAVGLSTKILSHNFQELCKASIAHLKGQPFKLYPDFPTGGLIDVTHYNNGERGGKVRVRAKIEVVDKKTLMITEIPFSTTTTSLIESILKANDKGKIKLKKVEDNTARNVEILVHLTPGVNPDIMVDALFAFSDCEVSISPNCCIIIDQHPEFTDVRKVLKTSTEMTKELLRRELEIKKADLESKWHMSSLEKIFIENRIYRDIEEEETWEGVIAAIDKGLDPFKKLLFREVTEEDINRLTEIRIKRISKFDAFKADEYIKKLEEQIEEVKFHLAHLTEFAVDYFQRLLEKYGEGRERKTEIRTFDTIERTAVAVANEKLYVDRAGGFVGTGLKKEEFVKDCSDIDDIIVFLADGTLVVTKVQDKFFVGKNIIHVDVWNKNDVRTTYHMIYEDPKDKRNYVKRFQVTAITRDRPYVLTKSQKPGDVLYFTANPNGESEVISVYLKTKEALRKTQFDFDFAGLEIKGRSAGGNLLTKWGVKKVVQKSQGLSTLGGRDIWFDDILLRLNTDKQGQYLGSFESDDRILALFSDGHYELTTFDLTNRYDTRGKILELAKLTKETVISAVHYDAEKDTYFVKRFQIETTTVDQKFCFISEGEGAKLIFATVKQQPVIKVAFASRKKEDEEINLETFIDVKGWKAMGNKLTDEKIRKVEMISFKEPEVKKPVVEEKDAPDDDHDDDSDDTSSDEPMDGGEDDTPPKTPPKITFEVEDKRDKGVQGKLF